MSEPQPSVTALLERPAARDSGLAVRKVEVPTFESPVATEHLAGVAGLPVVWILDRNGRVARKLVQVTPDQLDRALDEIVARSAGD